jgi:hypothetical protein
MVYYNGQDADSKIHFVKAGELWTQEDRKYASKIFT